MPNYQDGKIYKIYCPEHPEDMYVGSTVKLLCQRWGNHKQGYLMWKEDPDTPSGYTRSYDLFEKYGADNCIIELIKVFPCTSKEELHAEEAKYLTDKCTNLQIPGQTRADYKKKWREINREKENEQQRIRRENDPNYKQKTKLYDIANRERKIELQRIRRAKAKEAKAKDLTLDLPI